MSYLADESAGVYLYPAAGDPAPRPGAKVQLLTRGGVHMTGPWAEDGFYVAWLPLPKRNKEKEKLIGLI
jgi:hypothetical protein